MGRSGLLCRQRFCVGVECPLLPARWSMGPRSDTGTGPWSCCAPETPRQCPQAAQLSPLSLGSRPPSLGNPIPGCAWHHHRDMALNPAPGMGMDVLSLQPHPGPVGIRSHPSPPQFTEEETEAQKVGVTCLRPHR